MENDSKKELEVLNNIVSGLSKFDNETISHEY